MSKLNPCVCGQSVQNLGINSCPDLLQNIRRFIFVPEFNSLDVENTIATVAAVTKAALQAKFDNTTAGDRFFPSALLEEVVGAVADTTFKTYASGRKSSGIEGITSYTATIPTEAGAAPRLYSKMKSMKCKSFGFYGIDEAGNFMYKTDSAGILVKPIMFVAWDVKLIPPTNETGYEIMVTFDIRDDMDMGLVRYINANSLDFNGNSLTEVYSLFDLSVAYTSITTTGCHAYYTTEYGIGVTGVTLAQVAFNEISPTPGAATVSSVTADTVSGDGHYDIVWVAQTSGDLLRSTITKPRYDSALADAEDCLIPLP